MKQHKSCSFGCCARVTELETALADRDAQIRELGKMVAELQYAATRDGLTGLLRRGEADRVLRSVLSAYGPNEEVLLSCFFCDIDLFKNVNDTWGHAAGDLVIAKVADALRSVVRDVDVLARSRSEAGRRKDNRRNRDCGVTERHGGEEYLFYGMNIPDPRKKAEQLRKTVQGIRYRGFPNLKVTTSIGVAETVVVGGVLTDAQLSKLVKRADTALYAAKRGGRNRVVHFGDLVGTVAV